MEEELNINQENETVDSPQEPIDIEQHVPDGRDYVPEEEEKNEFGSCDCHSECKYNIGHTHKYADYGYSN